MTKEIKITLEDWMALNGCGFSITDYSLDKCHFPNGLSKHDMTSILKKGEEVALKYSEKRKKVQKQFCYFVEIGKILPLTSLEDGICKCVGNPELESVKASKKVLWKRLQKIPNSRLKVVLDIDSIFKEFGSNLMYNVSIDIDKRIIYQREKIIYRDKDCCLLSSCDDDSICLFGTDGAVFSLSYDEMRASIYGDSIERAKSLITK